MANHKYTEMQLRIISGEIPIETVDGRTLTWLYKKALANDDKALIEKTMIWLSASKIKATKKKRARQQKYKSQRKNGTFQWKQPKSNEYTEHQKQIVRGEIPYEDVHTKELISIHLKAHRNEDFELSERLLDIINTRRENAIAKEKASDKEYKKIYNKTHRIPGKFFSSNFYDNNSPYSQWEQAVLMGFVALDDCTEEQLQRILCTAQRQNDATTTALVNSFLLYKNDPEAVYIVRDHKEAVDMIEDLLGLPIRRPETWFTKDE